VIYPHVPRFLFYLALVSSRAVLFLPFVPDERTDLSLSLSLSLSLALSLAIESKRGDVAAEINRAQSVRSFVSRRSRRPIENARRFQRRDNPRGSGRSLRGRGGSPTRRRFPIRGAEWIFHAVSASKLTAARNEYRARARRPDNWPLQLSGRYFNYAHYAVSLRSCDSSSCVLSLLVFPR